MEEIEEVEDGSAGLREVRRPNADVLRRRGAGNVDLLALGGRRLPGRDAVVDPADVEGRAYPLHVEAPREIYQRSRTIQQALHDDPRLRPGGDIDPRPRGYGEMSRAFHRHVQTVLRDDPEDEILRHRGVPRQIPPMSDDLPPGLVRRYDTPSTTPEGRPVGLSLDLPRIRDDVRWLGGQRVGEMERDELPREPTHTTSDAVWDAMILNAVGTYVMPQFTSDPVWVRVGISAPPIPHVRTSLAASPAHRLRDRGGGGVAGFSVTDGRERKT